VGFDDPSRDESSAARTTAARLSTDHHETVVTATDALSVVDELPAIYDEPFADSSAIPTLLISRHAARSLKVVLTGDGGDELFSGYGRYRQLDELAGAHHRATGLVAGALAPLATSRSRWLGAMGNRAVFRHGTAADRYENLSALLTAPHLDRLTRGARPMVLRSVIGEAFAAFGVNGPRAADLRLYLPDDLLVKMDRASMSASLEVRSPLLHPDLVRWALGLDQQSLGPAGAKALPRALLEQVLPGDLGKRPKQGFSVPIADWLRGPLRPLLDSSLATSHLVVAGHIDREGVRDLVARLDQRRAGVAGSLWSLLCFELWYSAQGRHDS
jgi:asparagine synthase (glutamine-hydrolysing)